MNAPLADSLEIPQELIAKYFPVMAKHYAAAYRLSSMPPDQVRHDATERLTQSSAKTPRRAVDSILAALEAWRANANAPTARAA